MRLTIPQYFSPRAICFCFQAGLSLSCLWMIKSASPILEESAMARAEVTGKKLSTVKKIGKTTIPEDADDDDGSYTITEFCRRNKISLQAFYKYRPEMPHGYTVGTKRLISREEELEWRKTRTEAAKAEPLVTGKFHPWKKRDQASAQS
ncbi:hypothetical protein [Bradyrhizobium sp. CCBAU 11434]|uniref:hypothetical protein n=1 Tax=Bradyrhizobium sp. CCBAU 11434 TaxID=1630885 RepID=UPI002306942D|nr:hypothetical protein [Bradyrhizobium sp. CCBAU 11434]